jgi:hypothetical protein
VPALRGKEEGSMRTARRSLSAYGVEGAVRWMAGGKGKGKGDDLIVSKRGHLHD